MSSKCSAAVFDRYPAGGGEFALALALADNAHEDGTHIFPSVETMAKKSRQSVRAVQMHLRRMQETGWLLLVKNGQGGRGRLVEYRINPAWLKGADIAPFISPAEAVDNSQKGAIHDKKRVQNDALKGAKQSTKGCNLRHPYITNRTSIEPSPLPPEGHAPGFDAIAAGYPRQADMAKARKVFEDLAPDAPLQLLMQRSIAAWIPSPEWQREEGRFIPKFANWLRHKRWLDQPGVTAPPPAPPPPQQPHAAPAPMPDDVRAKVDKILGRQTKVHVAIDGGGNGAD